MFEGPDVETSPVNGAVARARPGGGDLPLQSLDSSRKAPKTVRFIRLIFNYLPKKFLKKPGL
jgi:hypothetical protein